MGIEDGQLQISGPFTWHAVGSFLAREIYYQLVLEMGTPATGSNDWT